MTPADNGQTLPRILVLECRAAPSTACHELILDSVTGHQTLYHGFKVDYIPAELFHGADTPCASRGCDVDVHTASLVGLDRAYGA
jgi:hypothetical protein